MSSRKSQPSLVCHPGNCVSDYPGSSTIGDSDRYFFPKTKEAVWRRRLLVDRKGFPLTPIRVPGRLRTGPFAGSRTSRRPSHPFRSKQKKPSGDGVSWWTARDSNPSPLPCHGSALPNELAAQGSTTLAAATKRVNACPPFCFTRLNPSHFRQNYVPFAPHTKRPIQQPKLCP